MKLEVVCRPSYECLTLVLWLREVSALIERESGEPVEVLETVSESVELDEPALFMDGEPILMGVPGEEGYLIEAVKHALSERRMRTRGGDKGEESS